jgi:rhamnose transport system ATP-binding protein
VGDSLLSLRRISKSFGPTRALDSIDLSFSSGEVHGLVGENGAGKSTLVRLVTGLLRPDEGQLELNGRAITLHGPRDALARGLCLVSQELTLLPARSVIDNVFLGHYPSSGLFIRTRSMRRRFQQLLDRTGLHLDADAPVRSLSVGQQQHVEVLRALSRKPRLIVFDEPTAALTEHETAQLLGLVGDLAAEGTAVVLISHFLEEVLATASTVSVLRDGALVKTGPARDETAESLVLAMVGRALEVIYEDPEAVPPEAPVVLRARGLRRGRLVRGVDLEVHAGEIVGLAGLIGSGRSEVARLIFGADHRDAGTIEVAGRPIRRPSPRAAVAAGVAMVPESRKDDGLVLVRSVLENLTLGGADESARAGIVRARKERQHGRELVERFDVRAHRLSSPMWQLSGGNQQKVLFAKWLSHRPRLLIADEPTRGVDIGAKVQIHQLLRKVAASGMGVLLISSEIEEILGLSHRVLVIRQGVVVREFDRADAERSEVLAAAFADMRDTEKAA